MSQKDFVINALNRAFEIASIQRNEFVTPEHICYVADRDAKSIFVFDAEGNLTDTYGKPDSAMYGESASPTW